MSEFFSNWTKIVIGICALIVTAAWAFGALPTKDLTAVMGVLLSAHGMVSGLNGVLGGPTRNSEVR